MISRQFVTEVGLSGISIQNFLNSLIHNKKEGLGIYDCVEEVLDKKCSKMKPDYVVEEIKKNVMMLVKIILGRSNSYNTQSFCENLIEYVKFSKQYTMVNTFIKSEDVNVSIRNMSKIVSKLYYGIDGLKIMLYDGSYDLLLEGKTTSIKLNQLMHIVNYEPDAILYMRLYQDNLDNLDEIGGIFIKNDEYDYRKIYNLEDIVKLLKEVTEYNYDLCILPDYRSIKVGVYDFFEYYILPAIKKSDISYYEAFKILLVVMDMDYKLINQDVLDKFEVIQKHMSSNNDIIQLLNVWYSLMEDYAIDIETKLVFIMKTYEVTYMNDSQIENLSEILDKLYEEVLGVTFLSSNKDYNELLKNTMMACSTLDELYFKFMELNNSIEEFNNDSIDAEDFI